MGHVNEINTIIDQIGEKIYAGDPLNTIFECGETNVETQYIHTVGEHEWIWDAHVTESRFYVGDTITKKATETFNNTLNVIAEQHLQSKRQRGFNLSWTTDEVVLFKAYEPRWEAWVESTLALFRRRVKVDTEKLVETLDIPSLHDNPSLSDSRSYTSEIIRVQTEIQEFLEARPGHDFEAEAIPGEYIKIWVTPTGTPTYITPPYVRP